MRVRPVKERAESASEMAQCNSDNESDTYSLLDMPRPSSHATMQQALTDGRMPELVLEGRATLLSSIAFCLEVLGIGTSGPERQQCAARALVGLCTHRKLRPAVDNLLVLRRLCRIIELTDCAAALAAAAEALFAVADDAAWQAKGGTTVEILREALCRCVKTISAVAARRASTSNQQNPKEPAGAAKKAPQSSDSPEDADQAALATAAAAVLRAPVLHLLSPSQLVDAAGALAACISGGFGTPEVLAALSAVVRHGPTGEDRAAVAAAVLDCSGAVAALLGALAGDPEYSTPPAAGAPPGTKGLTDVRVSAGGSPASAGGQRDSGAGGSCKTQKLTDAGRKAFSCLADVLEALSANGGPAEPGAIAGEFLHMRHIQTLLQVVQSEPEDASRALRCLLTLIRLSGDTADLSGSPESVMETVVREVQRRQGVAAALLDAASRLLEDVGAVDSTDGGCVELLFIFATELLLADEVTVEQLRQRAPPLTEAAVGVLAARQPAATWSGLFASVAQSVPEQQQGTVRYPVQVTAAAARVSFHLLRWAVEEGDEAEETGWLMPDKVADALIQRMLKTPGAGGNPFRELGGWGVRCLALCLQLSPPAGLWNKYSLSDLTELTQTLLREVRGHKDVREKQAQIPQEDQAQSDQQDPDLRDALGVAAAAVSLSLWSRIVTTDGSRGMQDFIKGILNLATASLERALANAAPHQTCGGVQQLARLGGVLNAVIGCLQPQLALVGRASYPLEPVIPKVLLPNSAVPQGAGGKPLLGLYYNFSDTRSPPNISLQLEWEFEVAPVPINWHTAFTQYAEQAQQARYHGYGANNKFGEGYTTIAATTAEDLLRLMGTAAARLSKLVEEQLEGRASGAPAGEGGDGAGAESKAEGKAARMPGVAAAKGVAGSDAGGESLEPAAAAALLRAAVRVAGNTAAVLAKCIPASKLNCS